MASATVVGVAGTALGVSAFTPDPSNHRTTTAVTIPDGFTQARQDAKAQAEARVAAISQRRAADAKAAQAAAKAAQKKAAAAKAAAARAAAQKAAAEKAAAEKAAKARAERRASARTADRASRSSARHGDPKAIARGMVAARGWGSSQFSCLERLWTKESGWSASAANPGSGAYGIPQALPGSKMASAGSDWRTNPATQIEWGLGYISSTYGTPCSAWSHSESSGWY